MIQLDFFNIIAVLLGDKVDTYRFPGWVPPIKVAFWGLFTCIDRLFSIKRLYLDEDEEAKDLFLTQ